MSGKESVGKDANHVERHEVAEEIRGWADPINRIRNSWAQRLPDVIGPLHDVIQSIEGRAQILWPERTVTGSGGSGPPKAGHVVVSAESVPAFADEGPQVAVKVHVSIDRGSSFDFVVPLRGVEPLIRALAIQHDYWREEETRDA